MEATESQTIQILIDTVLGGERVAAHMSKSLTRETMSFQGVMGQLVYVTFYDWLRLRRHYNCPGGWNAEATEKLKQEVELYKGLQSPADIEVHPKVEAVQVMESAE